MSLLSYRHIVWNMLLRLNVLYIITTTYQVVTWSRIYQAESGWSPDQVSTTKGYAIYSLSWQKVSYLQWQKCKQNNIFQCIWLNLGEMCMHKGICLHLAHLFLDKMAPISQTLFSYAFSWMESLVFWLKFHWCLFLRVQLTITQC